MKIPPPLSNSVRLAAAVASIALAGARQASAQTAPDPSTGGDVSDPADAHHDKAVELPSYTVSADNPSKYGALDAISSARTRADILDTPASISVISNALLTELAPTRLYDALQFLPGVTEANSPNISDRVTLRGFISSSGGSVDGINYIANSNVDGILVDRIEFVGGPNSVLSPNGLPGGTINTITKSPAYTESGFLRETLGHYYAGRTDFDITGPIAKTGFAYRVVASAQDTDKVNHDGKLKQTVIFPSLMYKKNNLTITAKFIYVDWKATWEGSLPIDPSVGTNTGGYAHLLNGLGYYTDVNPGMYRANKIKTTDIMITDDITSHIAGRVFLQYQDQHSGDDSVAIGTAFLTGGSVNPLTGAFVPGATFATTAPYAQLPTPAAQPNLAAVPFTGSSVVGRRFVTTFQNDYVVRYNLPLNTLSTTLLGFQSSELKTDNFSTTLATNPVNIFNPVFTTITATPSTGSSDNDLRIMTSFLMQRLAMFNQRLFLDGGVTTSANRQLSHSDPNVGVGASAFSRGNTTTYLTSILGKITPSLTAYVSFSENASPVSSGQPLDPIVTQFGKQKEVGVKSEFFHRRLRITGAYYDIAQTNFSVANYAHNLDPSLPSNLLLNLKSYGEEFAVVGALTSNIDIITSASHNHIRDPLNRRLRGSPDDSARALISYSFREGYLKHLGTNFGWTFTGSRAGDSQTGITAAGVPIQPSFYVAPLTLMRAGASYTWHRYNFNLVANNLANKKYLYGSARSATYAGLPFNLTYSMGVKF